MSATFRLAAHLGLAVVILAALVQFALDVLGHRGRRKALGSAIVGAAAVLLALTRVTIVSGGLVAGTDAEAGLPRPSRSWMDVWSRTVVFAGDGVAENPAAVQFAHRTIAPVTALAAGPLWLRGRRHPACGRFPGRA